MRLNLKDIDLKRTTMEDINSNPPRVDIDKYTNYITQRLSVANALLDNKIELYSDIELYDKLKVIFDIIVEPKDYLRVLSKIYNKHYTDLISIRTYMVDNDGNSIECFGASTKEVANYNRNIIDLNRLRKITDKNDFLVLKEHKVECNAKRNEKYESHQFVDIDVYNDTIDEDSELFPYLIEILSKDILVKDIIYSLRLYVNELAFQARYIANLSKLKKHPDLARIGKLYESALNDIFIELENPKDRKISVRKHKKIKYGGKYK